MAACHISWSIGMWRTWRIPALTVGAFLLCVWYVARRPLDRMMQVVCVSGDIYLPNLRPQTWNKDDVRKCALANRTPPTPNNATDVLLCGDTAMQAWALIWLRDDVKKSLYANSVQHQVSFHSSGHEGGRYSSPWWACKKTASSLALTLDCY